MKPSDNTLALKVIWMKSIGKILEKKVKAQVSVWNAANEIIKILLIGNGNNRKRQHSLANHLKKLEVTLWLILFYLVYLSVML